MWHRTDNAPSDKTVSSVDLHSTSADTSKEVNDFSNAEYAKPEIQRVEVNGDTYAVVNRSQRKPEAEVKNEIFLYIAHVIPLLQNEISATLRNFLDLVSKDQRVPNPAVSH